MSAACVLLGGKTRSLCRAHGIVEFAQGALSSALCRIMFVDRLPSRSPKDQRAPSGDLSIRAADRRKDPLEGIGVEWAVRRSSQLLEVEDRAGTAGDGASDDGHALGGRAHVVPVG